jgi:hypothetical protein
MSMRHSVTVRLGSFAVEALAGGAGSETEPSPADLERAIQFYLSQSRRRGPGWAYPEFVREQDPAGQVEIELEVDEFLWVSLEKEARRQKVTIPQLLEHASLYYAAEMDSGWAPEPEWGSGRELGRP